MPEALDAEIERQAAGRGDSVPFEEASVPTLFFGSGESSDYHAPSDVPETLEPAIMSARARAIARVVVAASVAPDEAFLPASPGAPSPPERVPRSAYASIGLSTGVATRRAAPALLARWLRRRALRLRAQGDARELRTGARARPFGLDGGLLVERAGGAQRYGWVARPMLTVSWLALTGRVGWLASPGTWFGEIGVLVKLPTAL